MVLSSSQIHRTERASFCQIDHSLGHSQRFRHKEPLVRQNWRVPLTGWLILSTKGPVARSMASAKHWYVSMVGTVHFYEWWGTGGIWSTIWKSHDPLTLAIFFPCLLPVTTILDDPPPKNSLSRFQLFYYSLLFPYFTLLCSQWRQYLQYTSTLQRPVYLKKIKRKRGQFPIS